MKALWQNFLQFWNKLENPSRWGLLAGVGVISLGLVLALAWLFSSDYKVLFADLAERDAAVLIEQLQKSKTPYKLADNGSKILVKEHQVHDTRIALMGKGLPLTGSVGFEIFDNKDMSMTEYTQKINYQRALQGELARTISAVDGVKFARVHLVVPETSLFRRQKTQAKASVSLVMKPGYSMSQEQIQGIQRLVAASVNGMHPHQVTVLDQQGIVLSPNIESDERIDIVSNKLRMKKEVEEYLSRKVVHVLDRTYGPGQAIVSMDVALNFDEIKSTQEEPISSKSSGKETGQGVVVRKRESIQRPAHYGKKLAEAADTGTEFGTAASTTEIEYEIGKRVEQVISTPGGIQQISVGVVVPAGVSADQVAKIQLLIGSIIGIQTARGDAITVQSLDGLVQKKLAGNNEAVSGDSDGAPVDGQTSDSPAAKPSSGMFSWLSAIGIKGIWQWITLITLVIVPALIVGWVLGGLRRHHTGRSGLTQTYAKLSEEERHNKLREIRAILSTGKTVPVKQ